MDEAIDRVDQGPARGAFLGDAGDERARRVLTEWARARHREGSRSFSELADETGLPLEEIMLAVGDDAEDVLPCSWQVPVL